MDYRRLHDLGVDEDGDENESPDETPKDPRKSTGTGPENLYKRFGDILAAKKLKTAFDGTPLRRRVPELVSGEKLETVAAAVLAEPHIAELLQTLKGEFGFDIERHLSGAGFLKIEAFLGERGRHDLLRNLALELMKLYLSHVIFYLGLEDASIASAASIREHLSLMAECALRDAEEFRRWVKNDSQGIVSYENRTIREAIEDLGTLNVKIRAMQDTLPSQSSPLIMFRDRILSREFVQ